ITENGDNEKMAALEAKICQQIEYYFGDFGLPQDKLNRLTTDFNVIVEALSKSKAELVEISEDKAKIRRSPSKPLREGADESLYIKGFPTDANLDDMKEWLEDKGQVLNIQMRRTVIESAKKFVETPEERKQNKVEAKLRAKQEQEAKQKLEDIGCLLKFLGDLDDQTCREDLHILFSNHAEIKWIDFIRGAKKGIILFKEKAKETLGKAKDANNGNLQLRNKEVTWEVLEGEVAKEALKKIIEDQQESLNKWKSKGCRFKGKGKGNKAAQVGSGKEKLQFQSKKKKFVSDDAHDENGAAGPMKRAREETDKEEPASKQPKTENGAGDQ
uniref:XRRM domain-containing protein n=1 Tax=Cercocebus atys TaxID=9531 RepID=A0A2K5NSZ5_CERAT